MRRSGGGVSLWFYFLLILNLIAFNIELTDKTDIEVSELNSRGANLLACYTPDQGCKIRLVTLDALQCTENVVS